MPTITITKSSTEKPAIEQQVYRSIQRRFGSCSYCFIFRKVTWEFDDGTLTLRGSVPSFYLKQTLQELLRDIDQVKQINNLVDVVNASGLSSIGPNKR
jgi:hypothetical protein